MKTSVPSMLVLGGVLIASSTYSPTSSACVSISNACVDPVRLFPNPDAGVPGNLVYFKILVDDPGPLALRTSLGEPIAASIRAINDDLIFAPDEAIPEGTEVVLEFSARCNPSGEVARTFEFSTAAPQSFDTGPMALRVVERGTAYDRNEEAAFVRVAVDNAISALSYHLKTNTITLDGAPLSVIAIPSVTALGAGLTLEVRSVCQPLQERAGIDSCGGTFSVPPGIHTLEIATTVVGAPTQPEPVVMEIETACPPGPEAPSGSTLEAPSGSTLDEPAIVDEPASIDEPAIVDEPASIDEPALLDGPSGTRASSGCTVALREGQARRTPPLGAALLSLSILIGRRWRRQRGMAR